MQTEIVQPDKTHFQLRQSNIDAELTNLLYVQATGAIVGSFLTATCIVFYLYYQDIQPQPLLGWYWVLCIVNAIRYILVGIYQNKKPPVEKADFWYKLFIIITVLAALTWIPVCTFLLPLDSTQQAIVVMALAGLTAGAIPYFSGSRLASILYITPILGSLTIKLVLQNDPAHRLLGVLALVYLGVLLISALRTYKSIRNTMILRFENIELIEKLDKEINEHKQTEELLRSSREQYALIMDALPGLIAHVDEKLHFRFNNKAFETWFEKPLSEITGKHLQEILNNVDYELLMANYPRIKDRIVNFETVMKFQNEKERYVSITLIPHKKNKIIQGFYLLVSDVTPRINYLATHDTLTNLPNRSLFIARFSRALKYAQAYNKVVGLLFLDLDFFKNINDTLGHDIGDQLLIKVAERLQECIGNNTTFARLGGDEFTVIFENVEEVDSLIAMAQKISRLFENAFYVLGREIFITTSIGISLYPNDGTEMQVLLKNADMAMYRAKERGRNTFEFFTQEINEKMVKKLALEIHLRSALDKQQFHIYYQPIVEIATGKIQSLEALLRWHYPDVGLIMPSDFIPLAENTGLIIPISEWIIQTVCHQNISWQQSGYQPLKIAINISAQQFKDRHSLLEKTATILKETGLDGKYITIEITESSIIDNIDYSINVLEALKKLNITISLDDFGTGYSSLNYLHRLPVDVLKIDRSFITNITTNEGSAKIVTAIINMAHTLKLKVVAEGVERFEQYSILKYLGCDSIQGYLIHPPLRIEEIAMLLKKGFSFEEHIKHRQLSQLQKDLNTPPEKIG